VHHKDVHVLLSGYLLGSRDLSFLDGIPDEHTEEWLAIEKSAQRGIDLCCEVLGRIPEGNRARRYNPPYSRFLLKCHRELLNDSRPRWRTSGSTYGIHAAPHG